MRRKRLWRNIGLFLCGLGLAYVFGCWQLARSYLSPDRQILPIPHGLIEGEWVLDDGKKLPVWSTQGLVDRRQSKQVAFLFVHALRGSRSAYMEAMVDLHSLGYESVAVALPGHDTNVETETTFGALEAKRIAGAARKMKREYGVERVVVVGLSMGGSSAWLASASDPSAIDAVVSDGSYARFDEAILQWLDRTMPFGSRLLKPVAWMVGGMARADLGSVRPVDAAAKWRGKPALVIVGEFDDVVPPGHSRSLAQAAACRLWVVPGAAHHNCYSVARDQYIAALVSVAKKVNGPTVYSRTPNGSLIR